MVGCTSVWDHKVAFDKTPLILTAFEGLTMAEAAQELGLTEKAVETRLYRARKRLAQMLEE